MARDVPGWIGRLFKSRYKIVGTLATILILGLGLYLLIQHFFPSVPEAEEQVSTTAAEPAQQILFQDDFTNPNSGWPLETLENKSFGYQSPAFYFLEVNAPNENLTVFRGLDLQDFRAKTKITVSYTDSLSGDFRYGLAFRQAGEQYYAFVIYPRRKTWQVVKHSPAGIELLAEGNRGSVPGIFQVTTLQVDASGSEFTFYVNDQPVTQLTDPDFISGDVGFIVETLEEVLVHTVYDSLIIQELEESSVTAALPVTTGSLAPTSVSSPVSISPASPTSTASSAPTTTPLPVLPTFIPSPTSRPPSPTPSPVLTNTPTPTPSPSNPTSSATSEIPTPSPTRATTPLPTSPTQVSTSEAPATTITPTPTPTSSTPLSTFELLKPLDLDKPTFGPTEFEWRWSGPVPTGYGFEVRVWRDGESQAGVHDAVLDNQNGNIQSIGSDEYRLITNIKDAAGVLGRSGEYLWTVALVQISPNYADLGQQAPPARLRFEAGGSSGDGGSGGGGGGGVGIH